MFGINESGWIGWSGFVPGSDTLNIADLLDQTMFAATAATIVAALIRFVPYLIGTMLITIVIYPVFDSWASGGTGDKIGWLAERGLHDTAGGTVVHSIGGRSALVALMVLDSPLERYSRKREIHDIPGHNLPMFALAGFLLWFGCFGFNGGAVKDDFSDLWLVLLNTNLAAGAGVADDIGTMLARRSPVLMTAVINGALGGLVSITAGCNVVEP